MAAQALAFPGVALTKMGLGWLYARVESAKRTPLGRGEMGSPGDSLMLVIVKDDEDDEQRLDGGR